MSIPWASWDEIGMHTQVFLDVALEADHAPSENDALKTLQKAAIHVPCR